MSVVMTYLLKGKPAAILLTVPILLLALLRLFPNLDSLLWSVSENTRLFQFYVGSLAGVLALIAALFAGTLLGAKTSTQALLVNLGFTSMAALLLVGSVAVPGLLVHKSNSGVFTWSLNLSFPVGALLFALAGGRWRPAVGAWLVAKRHFIWLAGVVLFGLYVIFVFSNPAVFATFSRFSRVIQNTLAVVTVSALFIAIRRRHVITQHSPSEFERSLGITFILLAEAQICLVFGEFGRLSWLLYHLLTLAALLVTLQTMLSKMERSPELKLTHYFAALGTIAIFGISLVIGEVGQHWLSVDSGRSALIPMALVQGFLSFLVLFLIVSRLNRLVVERTLALRREQHLRSELIQLIVHDLKSPLSVIKGGINLLTKARLGPMTATQTQLLMNLEQSGDDILQMINDLLDVERMEVGALQLQVGTVEAETLLHECVNGSQIIASTYKQNLTISHPVVLPRIQVDRNLLRRVLNNLLTNALKFTPERGEIQVAAGVEGDYLVIGVADSGPGVPAADRKRIFEKFTQVQGTERRGAGLGLAFCKMAVEAHGGTITVGESASGGALFEIVLPIKQTPEASAASQGKRIDSGYLVGDLYPENKVGNL